MIIILAISLFHWTLISFSRNTTVINFEEKMIVSKEMLQKTPPMLRDLIQKQINVDGEFAKTGNTSHRDSETAITSKPVKIKVTIQPAK